MLNKEELKLINNIFEKFIGDNILEEDGKKLRKKLSLLVKQIEVMEKAQQDAGEIQEKINKLESEKDGEKEES